MAATQQQITGDSRLKTWQMPDLVGKKSPARMCGSDIAAPATHSAVAAIPGRHAEATGQLPRRGPVEIPAPRSKVSIS